MIIENFVYGDSFRLSPDLKISTVNSHMGQESIRFVVKS